jgi:hypothetical protein
VIGGLCQNVYCEGQVKTFTAFGREIYHVFAILLTLQVAYSLKTMRSLAVSLQFSIPQPSGAATPIHSVIMSEEAILSSLLIRSSQNTMNDILCTPIVNISVLILGNLSP